MAEKRYKLIDGLPLFSLKATSSLNEETNKHSALHEAF